jgi:protein-S-isoprenylcysteine O-methyltransferase Ste14
LVLFFVLIRRSSQAMTRQPIIWVVAFGAGLIPLLASPGRPLNSTLLIYLCGVPMIMGIVLQVHAKICLGRSFGCVPAHRGLRFGGPYRFMRHPMYTGYLMTYFAFLGLNPSWWNLGVYSICLCLMIVRIVLEERLLSNDPEYRAYQEEVPYRLIPGVF